MSNCPTCGSDDPLARGVDPATDQWCGDAWHASWNA